jgi:adenylate cyclase
VDRLPRSEHAVSRAATSRPVISIAAKWTLAIALLLVLGMGLLGAYLIAQQEQAFDRHSRQLGELLADQLARSASEPLMADDLFQLEMLVRRQLDQGLVLGAAVLDPEGAVRVSAGSVPTGRDGRRPSGQASVSRRVGPDVDVDGPASVHVRPIVFQDVKAGHVVLSLDRASLEGDRRLLVSALVATTVLLIAFTGLLAIPLANWMSGPIRRLADWTPDSDAGAGGQAGIEGRPPRDEVSLLAQRLRTLSLDAAAKQGIEAALNRYLSPDIARSVLADPGQVQLQGKALRGSVLFCDIVEFTQLSRRLPPEQLAALVNDYFGAFARAGAFCGGTVDKFIGDSVMMLFGVPEPDDRHALNAVVCGLAIVRLGDAINVRRRALGLPTVAFRLAINSGLMQAGNLGSLERMEFTVLGDSVNLAARLCARCPAGELVISADTLSEPGVRAQAATEPLGPLQLKGYDEPVTAYVVRALAPDPAQRVEACLATVNDAVLEAP